MDGNKLASKAITRSFIADDATDNQYAVVVGHFAYAYCTGAQPCGRSLHTNCFEGRNISNRCDVIQIKVKAARTRLPIVEFRS